MTCLNNNFSAQHSIIPICEIPTLSSICNNNTDIVKKKVGAIECRIKESLVPFHNYILETELQYKWLKKNRLSGEMC